MAAKSKTPSFALGDIVELKAQPGAGFTVSPPPTGQSDLDGWVWVVRATEHQVTFHLLPVVALALNQA